MIMLNNAVIMCIKWSLIWLYVCIIYININILFV